MNRERVLTVAGGFAAVVMVGLLSYTTLNGRTLGPPRHAHGDEVDHGALARELRGIVRDQETYRERQRTYTTNLDELGFESHHPNITVTIRAADKHGWTAVAVSREARLACIMRVGEGGAAGAEVDPYLAGLGVDFERVETCEVSDATVSPSEILGSAGNRS
jgi:hypothetical protein